MTDAELRALVAEPSKVLDAEVWSPPRYYRVCENVVQAVKVEVPRLLDRVALLEGLLDRAAGIIDEYSPGHTVLLGEIEQALAAAPPSVEGPQKETKS